MQELSSKAANSLAVNYQMARTDDGEDPLNEDGYYALQEAANQTSKELDLKYGIVLQYPGSDSDSISRIRVSVDSPDLGFQDGMSVAVTDRKTYTCTEFTLGDLPTPDAPVQLPEGTIPTGGYCTAS